MLRATIRPLVGRVYDELDDEVPPVGDDAVRKGYLERAAKLADAAVKAESEILAIVEDRLDS